jgi:hypothetical protein
LEQARQNNYMLAVTGMLLYKNGNSMRVEGEKEGVTELTRTIDRDRRHKGILILLRGTTEDWLFPDWSMGFRNLAEQGVSNTPGYTNFMNTPLTGVEFSPDPDRCMKLMQFFKKKM